MRLMHLSDLHLGKIVNGFSMLEDQKYILNQILQISAEQRIDAVLLCGDIYDRAVPSEEAVLLFDEFLTALAERELPVFIISGNHDSAARLGFGARLMEERQIHLAGTFTGTPEPIILKDAYGETAFYLLPFIKPVHVRTAYADEAAYADGAAYADEAAYAVSEAGALAAEETLAGPASLRSYQEALAYVMAQIQTDPNRRNVILAHQFVTGAQRTESETFSVGGTDNIDSSLFDAFDYAALGHIHRPQSVGRPEVRYCGTPLKYSFSEADHEKSVTIAELKEKGNISIETVPLRPLRDLRVLRGSYEELTLRENYRNTNTADYLHVILTDEEDILDAMQKLRTIYPNIMKLEYDNLRTSRTVSIESGDGLDLKSPLDLTEEFYELQNNRPPCEEQEMYLRKTLDRMAQV